MRPQYVAGGVKPIQAEKSRPRGNVSAGGAKASSAVAMTGPIPGMLMSRLATSSCHRRRSLLFLAFNCYETHSWSHSRLADGFRIGRIVLLALYERAINFTRCPAWQSRGPNGGSQHTPPLLQCTDHAPTGRPATSCLKSSAEKAPIHRSIYDGRVNLNYALGQIQADYANLFHGRSPL